MATWAASLISASCQGCTVLKILLLIALPLPRWCIGRHSIGPSQKSLYRLLHPRYGSNLHRICLRLACTPVPRSRGTCSTVSLASASAGLGLEIALCPVHSRCDVGRRGPHNPLSTLSGGARLGPLRASRVRLASTAVRCFLASSAPAGQDWVQGRISLLLSSSGLDRMLF